MRIIISPTAAIALCTIALPLCAANALSNLRPHHPRLYRDASGFETLKARVAKVESYRSWYAQLQRDAEAMLAAPALEHSLDGVRMLAQSRLALDRISLLAGLYRLDGDPRKLRRAKEDMLTAAAFPDWNPRHFLDTAEMTHALAIGYDWLYNELSDEDRATIRRGIIENGLLPGQNDYDRGASWTKRTNNWNQVCNAGLAIGALAIADEEPKLALATIDHGRKSIVRSLRAYMPDGGFAEGPMYWDYGTRYSIYYLAALETALNTDFGLLQTPGFSQTGDFRLHFVGPSGLPFNYGDGRETLVTAPQMFWLARKFRRPDYVTHEQRHAADRPDIFHLIWSSGEIQEPSSEPPPSKLFRGINVAFLRSDWSPAATFVGFKAGDNRASHGHLDLGSFVFDSQGVRWAIDLGMDDYNLPRYFGANRWNYFRLSSKSHNTLSVDDEHQDPNASAQIVTFESQPGRTFAIADLSAAYPNKFIRWRRGIGLRDDKSVLVQDEITAASSVTAIWNMFTRAEIKLDGRRAQLTMGDAKLHARILSPDGATFEIALASAPPPEAQQPDVRGLRVSSTSVQGDERVAILLSPTKSSDETIRVEPLDDWSSDGTSRDK